ncbi:MAG: hypothetical protein E7080_05185 [Bacteroidales bacterium]|nr:hypothetical protein [Bacteroidales bacterium]
MRVKVFLFVVVCVLCCVPAIVADDIYYRVDRSSKKEKKHEEKVSTEKTYSYDCNNMSPEEFKNELVEFGKKSLDYELENLSKNTVIGKLIQKKWYELNPSTMQMLRKYYVEYTFTDRILVVIDEKGNLTERFQPFYLSNKYETVFDSTKVGKNDNGKYMVVRSYENPDRAICFVIESVSENRMNIIEDQQGKDLHKYYLADTDIFAETPIELSPSETLINRTWLQVDENTGVGMRYEYRYEPYGYMEKCVMGENRRTEFPRWLIGEYYFSNEPDTVFLYSKKGILEKGRYIVNHIKGENSTESFRTYEVKSLSADTILLECVYPENGENLKLASIVKHNTDSTTVLDKLAGKQWRIQQDRYDRVTRYRRSYSGALYFTENQFVGPWIKTTDNKVIDDKIFVVHDFFLSDVENNTFLFENIKKNRKNGKYIVFSHNGRQGAGYGQCLEILYLSENMLVVRNIRSTHNIIYMCE